MTPAQEKILKQAAADAKEAVRLARLAFWSLEGQDDALAGAGRTRGSHRQLMKDLAADLGAKVDAEPDAAGDVDVDELLAAVQALPAKMVDELKARL